MEEQIEKLLLLDKNSPFQAEAIVENIIRQNFHLFFDTVIHKIDQLSSQTPQINQNHDKSSYEILKRLVFILDRQLTKVMRNLQHDKEDMTQDLWSIINIILTNPNLNFKTLEIIVYSLANFLNICNQSEIKYIYLKISSNNENPDTQIILLHALLDSNASNKIVYKIGSRIIDDFEKNLVPRLNKLIKRLQEIQDQKTAVKMVCTTARRWRRYQEVFLKFFYAMEKQELTLECIIEIFQTKQFLRTIKVLLAIDEFLLLKDKEININDKFIQEESKDFKLLLQSDYKNANLDINLLKSEIFKVVDFVVLTMLKNQQNEKLVVQNQFMKFLKNNLIPSTICDLYLLGKTDPQDQKSQRLSHETQLLIKSIITFLSNLIEVNFLRNSLIQAINDTVKERQFLFFGCICNIQRFQEKYFRNEETFIQSQQLFKSKYFMTTFMKKILPQMNLDKKVILNFTSKVASFIMDQNMSLAKISEQMELSQEIQNQILTQELSLYLHILQALTTEQDIKYHKKQWNSNLFEVIQLGLFDFEKLTKSMKAQFLSITLNLSHLWSVKGFFDTIDKMINKIKEYLELQTSESKLILDFCLSAIIKLLSLDVEKKNYNSVIQFFQCLIKYFQIQDMDKNQEICIVLSNLTLNDTWNRNRSAFDGNFMILNLCYEKICELKFFWEDNQFKQEKIGEFLPKEQFVILIKSCILALQISFDSEDIGMQVKISKMRQIVIEIFSFLKNFIRLFSETLISELCATIEVVTGIHLQEKVSPELCIIIKVDSILVETFIHFLQSVESVGRSHLQSVGNIIISMEGNISRDFLLSIFRKINRYLQKMSILNVDLYLLSEILHLINLIFLYQIDKSINIDDLSEVFINLLKITESTEKCPKSQSARQSQRFRKNSSSFTRVQIKLLQFKFFLISTNSQKLQNLKLNDFGEKQIKFSDLAYQFKHLKKNMSLEDLTFIVFGLQNCIKKTDESLHKKFILRLGLDFLAIKYKKFEISSYLKRRFDPIEKVKNMIFEMMNRPGINLKEENLVTIEELLDELGGFTLQTPTPRKIIKARKDNCIESIKKSPQKYDEDVII